MLSIQDVAKMTGLTSRALRLYEEVGILGADKRNAAGMRLYSPDSVDRLKRIVAMKATGITLKELSTLLEDGEGGAIAGVFAARMAKIDAQIADLTAKRATLASVLATDGALAGIDVERRLALSPRERLELFALEKLDHTPARGAYLADELECLKAVPEAFAVITAVKKVVDFARAANISMSEGRGSAPSSLLLHLVGFSSVDPVTWGLQAARAWGARSKAVHVDVSFAHGKPVVELCEELSATLRPWRIEAFRLPLLDIFAAVEARVGTIDYDAIPDDADEVLGPFRAADCEKILWFDEPGRTMAAKIFPEQVPGWEGFEKMNEYLRGQEIRDFRDVMNLFALRRPKDLAMIGRMYEYAEKKRRGEAMTIYHEEIVAELRRHLPCGAIQANELRWRALKGELTAEDRRYVVENGSEGLLPYLEREAPVAFCRAHVSAHGRLVKRCAVLKTRHRDVYFEEIARWENRHGLSWSDFGLRTDDVCLLK